MTEVDLVSGRALESVRVGGRPSAIVDSGANSLRIERDLNPAKYRGSGRARRGITSRVASSQPVTMITNIANDST